MKANTRFLEMCLLAASFFVPASRSEFALFAAEEKAQPKGPWTMASLPPESLQIREAQILLRKRPEGWQVCRVKRFVWQEKLVSLGFQNKTLGFIRERDATDSGVESDDNGFFIVLAVAPNSFARRDAVKIDEDLLSSMKNSDEILVKATKVKFPEFFLIDR
jgi:hypothetical protein